MKSQSRRSAIQSILPLFAAAVAPRSSFAQEWPTKPLTFVVPFPPGGSNDIVARLVGEGVRQRIGQTVSVENKPGANGYLGMETAHRSAKDQHTFLIASDSVSLLPLFRSAQVELTKQFLPVALLAIQPLVIVTAPSTGIKSMKDLIAQARAKPNQIPYATSGQGSLQHLVGELLSQQLGIDMLHVPYKGGGQAVNDVVAGQVSVAVLGAGAVLSQVKAGRLIALAVSTKTRSPMLPDTPTLAESGATDMDVPQWSALFAPEGTSPQVLARLKRGVEESLTDPTIKQRLLAASMEPLAISAEAFQARIIQDRNAWGKLIKDRRISLE